MNAKYFSSSDARSIIARIVDSTPAGYERDALLTLAGEALREASELLHGKTVVHKRVLANPTVPALGPLHETVPRTLMVRKSCVSGETRLQMGRAGDKERRRQQ